MPINNIITLLWIELIFYFLFTATSNRGWRGETNTENYEQLLHIVPGGQATWTDICEMWKILVKIITDFCEKLLVFHFKIYRKKIQQAVGGMWPGRKKAKKPCELMKGKNCAGPQYVGSADLYLLSVFCFRL